MGRTTLIIVAGLALIAAGCSSDDGGSGSATSSTPATTEPAQATTDAAPAPTTESTAAPSPTSAPEPEPTPAPEQTAAPGAGALPETPVVASLSEAYDFEGGTPDPAVLPAQPGDVEAHWYRAGDVLAVVYVGLDAAVDACPGNSALLTSGFDYVSNAELPAASCPDFSTLIESTATQGVQICDGRVGYLTLIPADTIGQLFSSVEKPVPEVRGVGLTGFTVLSDPSSLPEIDLSSLAC